MVCRRQVALETAGALLAAFLLVLSTADAPRVSWRIVGFFAFLVIPLMPGISNFVVRKVAAPNGETGQAPRVKSSTLAVGLACACCGWSLQGVSLWALLQAILSEPRALAWQSWSHYTAFVALATLTGFLVVAVPGGLGVREFTLQHFLASELAAVLDGEQALFISAVAVLLLRLVSLLDTGKLVVESNRGV
jgi:uncharacterized membrane protein YbhN (UPF0104 family)